MRRSLLWLLRATALTCRSVGVLSFRQQLAYRLLEPFGRHRLVQERIRSGGVCPAFRREQAEDQHSDVPRGMIGLESPAESKAVELGNQDFGDNNGRMQR